MYPFTHDPLKCGINCTTDHARLTIEREIIRYTIRYLMARNMKPICVDTGDASDQYIQVNTVDETLTEVFSVDTCTITFEHQNTKRRYGVLIVLGNREDVISDYSYPDNERDPFVIAMNDIEAYIEGKYR